MSRRRYRWQSLTLSLMLCWTAGAAKSDWNPPVGRSTNDRNADLLAALIQATRFDDALTICEAQLRGTETDSDQAAKWTIRKSQVLAARQMNEDRFRDEDVVLAQKPIADMLKSYPRHRRRAFLEAAATAVAREAALHSVLRAAISPNDERARSDAVKRLLRATKLISDMADRVGDERSRRENSSGVRDYAMASDLVRLQQELQVDVVSLALMQTELFPRGGTDCIAAATKAEQAARDAIARLPADTAARLEVERLKVEAILRAEQLNAAEQELAALIRVVGNPLPPRIQAMQVRLDLGKDQVARAGARLSAFYGDSPASAPKSLAMDLARLEFLLRDNRGNRVGQWLDSIESRGGRYARRRAEVISLALVRGGTATGRTVDPSLVAAQGQDWLRRGDPGRAGDMLSAAAAADTDHDRAITRAREAAAALAAAGRGRDAADVLANLAAAKPDGKGAAEAHLQAAVMRSSAQDMTAEELEKLLRFNLNQWPAGPTADASRRWLQKLLASQDRWTEAAEVASTLATGDIQPDRLQVMVDAWRQAFRALDGSSLDEISSRFERSIRPLLSNETAHAPYRLAAALLLDRPRLASLDPTEDQPQETFGDSLLRFRRDSIVDELLEQPPDDLVDDATWRLMRDGRMFPRLRPALSQLLDSWSGQNTPSLWVAERLLWQGQTDKAVSMMRLLISQSPDKGKATREAARLLGGSGVPDAKTVAIELWDEIAAGTKQGSDLWHDAKIAAIELLKQAGKSEEAARRAKYILLTMPGMDDERKQAYNAASRM